MWNGDTRASKDKRVVITTQGIVADCNISVKKAEIIAAFLQEPDFVIHDFMLLEGLSHSDKCRFRNYVEGLIGKSEVKEEKRFIFIKVDKGRSGNGSPKWQWSMRDKFFELGDDVSSENDFEEPYPTGQAPERGTLISGGLDAPRTPKPKSKASRDLFGNSTSNSSKGSFRTPENRNRTPARSAIMTATPARSVIMSASPAKSQKSVVMSKSPARSERSVIMTPSVKGYRREDECHTPVGVSTLRLEDMQGIRTPSTEYKMLDVEKWRRGIYKKDSPSKWKSTTKEYREFVVRTPNGSIDKVVKAWVTPGKFQAGVPFNEELLNEILERNNNCGMGRTSAAERDEYMDHEECSQIRAAKVDRKNDDKRTDPARSSEGRNSFHEELWQERRNQQSKRNSPEENREQRRLRGRDNNNLEQEMKKREMTQQSELQNRQDNNWSRREHEYLNQGYNLDRFDREQVDEYQKVDSVKRGTRPPRPPAISEPARPMKNSEREQFGETDEYLNDEEVMEDVEVRRLEERLQMLRSDEDAEVRRLEERLHMLKAEEDYEVRRLEERLHMLRMSGREKNERHGQVYKGSSSKTSQELRREDQLSRYSPSSERDYSKLKRSPRSISDKPCCGSKKGKVSDSPTKTQERKDLRKITEKDEEGNKYSGYPQIRPEMLKGALPNLPMYDGKASWRNFKNIFTRHAFVRGWNATEQKMFFGMHLTGEAQSHFDGLQDHISLTEVFESMEQRFGKTASNETLREIFMNLEQGVDTTGQFADRLRTVASDCYRGQTPSFVESELIRQFIKGCQDKEAALHATGRNFQSLQEVMSFFTNFKERQISLGLVKKGRSSRTRDKSEEEIELEELVGQVRRLQEGKEAGKAGNDSKRGLRCYRCDQLGHRADQCQQIAKCHHCKQTGHTRWNCPMKDQCVRCKGQKHQRGELCPKLECYICKQNHYCHNCPLIPKEGQQVEGQQQPKN